ncbi:MAG: hypothetical protein ACFUZC_12235 [Chthoniobacteraceae bacterium]
MTIHFTYAEAKAVVERVVVAYHDTTKQPALCEYCRWCNKEATCPARLALAQEAVGVAEGIFFFMPNLTPMVTLKSSRLVRQELEGRLAKQRERENIPKL